MLCMTPSAGVCAAVLRLVVFRQGFDTPFPQRSHFTHMPMFLGGVSVHPAHQAWHSAPFEDQFTDPTAFPHSVLVSLDFPSVVSVAAARFFRKCYATTAAGHTVVLVGGFRDSSLPVRHALTSSLPVRHTYITYIYR